MEKYIVELIQAEPDGLDECLYSIDGKYLHVQRSDEGVDYTFYDMKSFRDIDGGQLDIEILDKIQEVQDAAALNMRMRYNADRWVKG